MLLGCPWFLSAFQRGGPVEYVGGTLDAIPERSGGTIATSDPVSFIFQSKRATVRVPYDRINLLEYGQNASRRILESLLVSPLFILSRKRVHFLTVGYETEDGRQQAMVFRVHKRAIRTVLASLEARTGRKVVFQDNEARKAGRG
jgi:hypothetical protein